ncbi:MAG: hypothetical protein JOZ84_11225 [Methylobacteriaceae bacterium]|nr:hypothetical protein [Methylobacteriaceae bacterium]
MAVIERVRIPSAEKIYDGSGKTLDDAIKDAQKKIPRHRPAAGHNEELIVAKEGAAADVPIRCKVIDIRYESGGLGGLSTFLVRVIED